jgi:putative chitinase
MKITAGELEAIFPKANTAVWAPAISKAWEKFGIKTVNAGAGFLGIIGNETGGLVAVKRENMHYTATRAAQVFKKAREKGGTVPSETCKQKVAAGEQAFANWIYADVIGNGHEASGDGWRFRGGGIIQLTGRSNYKAAGDALGVSLVADPDSLTSTPERSAAAAAWFMVKRVAILPLLDSDKDEAFLKAAGKVGVPPDGSATKVRLAYRKQAQAVMRAGY